MGVGCAPMEDMDVQDSLLPELAAPRHLDAAAREVEVARVLVDVDLPHLDHLLDYEVPERLLGKAEVGRSVRVRLAGKLHDGWIRERLRAVPDRPLQPLQSVTSDLPVLTAEVAREARMLADRSLATAAQVLSLAIPPRHRQAEKSYLAAHWAPVGAPATTTAPRPRDVSGGREALAADTSPDAGGPEHTGGAGSQWRGAGAPTDVADVHAEASSPPSGVRRDSAPLLAADVEAWKTHPGGFGLLERLAAGEGPHVVWTALPTHRDAQVVALLRTVHASGRTALLVVPTTEEARRWHARLSEALPGLRIGLGGAEGEPAARWTLHLEAIDGLLDVVVGTRSAVWTPLARLGALIIWDDGDDRLREQRAPRVDALDVAMLRAHCEGAALVAGAWTRSVKAQALVSSGWAVALEADRDSRRASTPRVRVLDEHDTARDGAAGYAHLPPAVHRLIRDALEAGPVLVQVPRAGWVPVVACDRCRRPARCTHCEGPLANTTGRGPSCGWCGRGADGWTCRSCGATRLRALRIGSQRTGEELGRAFPGAPLTVSSATNSITRRIDGRPRLVVATPGAEPEAEGGYAAVAVLDAPALAGRPELWAPEEAVRRWMNALALARPLAPAIVAGGVEPLLAQTLVRWDPARLAADLLAEREEIGLFPAVNVIALDGLDREVEEVLGALAQERVEVETMGTVAREPETRESRRTEEPGDGLLLTPGSVGTRVRTLIRSAREQTPDVLRALRHVQQSRSSRRQGLVRLTVNPPELF